MAKFTFKLERPKKDGSRKIIIHIEHRLGRKNIPTPFYAQKSDLHKSGVIKNALLLQEVLKFRNECESIYASAGMVGITFTAKEIGDYIVKRLESDKAKERAKNGIDIIAFIEHIAKSKSAEKTQEGYKNLAKRLQNFVGDNILFTSAITVSFLKMFEKTIGGNGRNANKIMTNFKACFLQARKEYNNSDDGDPNIITNNPFEHYDIPKNPVGAPPAPLTPENYTALMNYEPTEARETLAKDVFLFSLFTCGMNTADIYALTKENIKDGRIIYCRRKVSSRRSDKALISIPLNNYATAFLDKYITVSGAILFSVRYANYMGLNQNTNKGLKKIGKAIGVPDLYFYQARDTFASWCRNLLGVSRDDIDFCLNHARSSVLDRYVKADFSIIDKV
ncbi:MAG: site-specific integrase, partial [Bacteroidales bacterium]|nr:site-specific integrase [Bacteroidales bacterium]